MNRLAQEIAVPIEMPAEPVPGILADVLELTKARLTMLVVITTFVGYCMVAGANLDWGRLFQTLLGTALVAAGAQTLNQVIEQKVDRLMVRTRHRPLPAGRIGRICAARFGIVLAGTGLGILLACVSTAAFGLAAATLAIYLAAYTPMKRKTERCIPVGAVAGAIPPVIGAVAADIHPGWPAWVLFAILFTWQMPHFLAIAWMYREDYAGAGFVMLKPGDSNGAQASGESFIYSVLLLLATLAPLALGAVHWAYAIVAVGVNGVLLLYAFRFLRQRTRSNARNLFFASIIYLPLILGALVFAQL